ncbi:MAG: ATP-binding cassette domain-containing protein [Anaerolineales bacterium]|nr:ATP-binding cassette domain-containing protein [Anaerolineales bacterium]
MNAFSTSLAVSNVNKNFEKTHAVVDLSFEVRPGEIFAMLGPNGAGKTTMIRMALDILRPDSGRIEVLGSSINQAIKDRIGYLPEERGLYRDMVTSDCLAYLGMLKGMDRKKAKTSAVELLNRVGLEDVVNNKVSTLSRGMQQKAQFVATIIHDPDLIIVDEPFSGLDPVNTLVIKEVLYDLKEQGKTIIMSTHMMHQVEEMADRMLMIDKGSRVLYGRVEEIRQNYAAHAVYVRGQGDWRSIPGVDHTKYDKDEKADLVTLQEGVSADDFLRSAAARQDVRIDRFEVALPSLDDIFIQVAGGNTDSKDKGNAA